jgi:hypothetical protein
MSRCRACCHLTVLTFTLFKHSHSIQRSELRVLDYYSRLQLLPLIYLASLSIAEERQDVTERLQYLLTQQRRSVPA